MDVLQISIITVFGVMTAALLKGYKAEFSMLLVLGLSFLLLWKGIGLLEGIQSELSFFRELYEKNSYYYQILFKIIGITYLSEFTSGICKDAGYSSVSGQVELLGKLLILISGMPVLAAIVELLWAYEG